MTIVNCASPANKIANYAWIHLVQPAVTHVHTLAQRAGKENVYKHE